jgi:tRNA A37 N6-isopentenylltransferase MiaA
MPDEEEYFRNIIRQRAKTTTSNILDTYVQGRLGLVIDATGRDLPLVQRQVSMLRNIGYDCYMVFVNTSLDVALERNKTKTKINTRIYCKEKLGWCTSKHRFFSKSV